MNAAKTVEQLEDAYAAAAREKAAARLRMVQAKRDEADASVAYRIADENEHDALDALVEARRQK